MSSAARQACSQRRQASAHTRQCSMPIRAWTSHSSAHTRQASAHASSTARLTIGSASMRRESAVCPAALNDVGLQRRVGSNVVHLGAPSRTRGGGCKRNGLGRFREPGGRDPGWRYRIVPGVSLGPLPRARRRKESNSGRGDSPNGVRLDAAAVRRSDSHCVRGGAARRRSRAGVRSWRIRCVDRGTRGDSAGRGVRSGDPTSVAWR